MATLNFNVNDVPVTENFDPIPAGDYICYLEQTEQKETQSGKRYLEFAFTVVEGAYKGRKVWEKFYIYNPENEKANNYAKRAFAQMLRAQGLQEIQDTCELERRNYLLSVGIEHSEGYKDKNNIKEYRAVPQQDFVAQSDLTQSPW